MWGVNIDGVSGTGRPHRQPARQMICGTLPVLETAHSALMCSASCSVMLFVPDEGAGGSFPVHVATMRHV